MQTPDNDSEKKHTVAGDYVKYAGMAIKMGAVITLSVFLGKYLDKAANTTESQAFLITFSLLGVGLAIYSTIRDLIK